MIQPQELRIGNYFINHKWRWEQVISIDDNNSMSVNGLSKEMITPIAITPEILERCGFEYIDMPVNGYADDKHLCYQQIDGTIVFMPFCTDDKDCHIHIKYLHQLQNIIYSLSGQELTLKTTNNE